MTKYILSIDGMSCAMCEAHINDAVRSAFRVKKVSSSHSKNETVIISDTEIDQNRLRDVIDSTGYKLMSIASTPYEKKGLFGAFKK